MREFKIATMLLDQMCDIFTLIISVFFKWLVKYITVSVVTLLS